MTTPPDWLLEAYEASEIPEFVAFARPARLAAQAPDSGVPSSLKRELAGGATVQAEGELLTPERLQELEAQYKVSRTSGQVQVTELVPSAGFEVQAFNPAWPQHLMMSGDGDGSPGSALIQIQYMLPELLGEDLDRCAIDCQEAIYEVLPVTWRGSAEIVVERQVSWEHLNISCSCYLDALPGVEQCVNILREVAVRAADQNLLGVLEAALSGQEEVQAQLTAATEQEETEDEEEPEQQDEGNGTAQALQSLLLRVVYQRELEETPDGSWRAYVALKPERAHLMERFPVGLMLEPLREYTVLMVTLRFDELDDPAVEQRLGNLRRGDPVWALVEAFSREHLTALDLAGTLHIDISLEDALLKVHFVSPGTVAKEEALKKLFEVLDACQQHDFLMGIQEALQDEGEDEGTAEETTDGDVVLSAAFLKRAGFSMLDMRGDSFTETTWDGHDDHRGIGFLWRAPNEGIPYPVLAIRVAAVLPEAKLQSVLAAAMQDHFIQFKIPPALVNSAGHHWMAVRTLTPGLYVHRQGNGQVQVAIIRTWPIFGRVTPDLLRYQASTTFGQFQDLLKRAGFEIEPDYTFPGATGRGERDWLTGAHLLQLTGEAWPWSQRTKNEVISSVRAVVENQREQPRKLALFRKPQEKLELVIHFYLRYVNEEEDSAPALYLRAHTEGGLARNHLDALTQHHLEQLQRLTAGALLPVTVDKDGDLTVRQIVLCPERPTPELVRHLVQVAERSLYFAAQQVLF